jgi:hypothetical protein
VSEGVSDLWIGGVPLWEFISHGGGIPMPNRRFEMHEIRQVVVQMRLGRTDRQIARAGLMGRRKASELRRVASERGWLNKDCPLPDNATLAEVLGQRPLVRVGAKLSFPWNKGMVEASVIKPPDPKEPASINFNYEFRYANIDSFLCNLDEFPSVYERFTHLLADLGVKVIQ